MKNKSQIYVYILVILLLFLVGCYTTDTKDLDKRNELLKTFEEYFFVFDYINTKAIENKEEIYITYDKENETILFNQKVFKLNEIIFHDDLKFDVYIKLLIRTFDISSISYVNTYESVTNPHFITRFIRWNEKTEISITYNLMYYETDGFDENEYNVNLREGWHLVVMDRYEY